MRAGETATREEIGKKTYRTKEKQVEIVIQKEETQMDIKWKEKNQCDKESKKNQQK